MGSKQAPERPISLGRPLRGTAALLLMGLGAALAATIVPAVGTFLRADHDLADIRRYEALLVAAGSLAAERIPANLLVSVEPGSEAGAAARLAPLRAATDVALAAAERGDPSDRIEDVSDVIDDTRRRLLAARAEIDRVAALPVARRNDRDVAGAIDGMFGAADAFQPAIAASARHIGRNDPSLAGPTLIAHLVGEMRDFGGRAGTTLLPAVSKRRQLTAEEITRFERIVGQIRGLHRILEGQSALEADGPLGAEVAALHATFLGEGLDLLSRLVAEGRTGGRYSVEPGNLIGLYVPALEPVEQLRDLYIGRMVASVAGARHAAVLKLAAVLAAALAAVAVLLTQLFALHRSVVRPLLGARERVLALAEDRPPPEAERERSEILEVGRLLEALRVLTLRLEERHALTAQLRRRAETDALTGLANRSRFEAMAREGLARARTDRFAVLYIDLDGFKSVNDTLGHHLGDRLLVEVAGRLRDATAGRAVVARLGGDEFAALCLDLDLDGQSRLAGDILRALARPVDLETGEVRIGASIGIAALDAPDSGFGLLCRRADRALYQAKEAGRNTWRRFGPDMDPPVRAPGRGRVEPQAPRRLSASPGRPCQAAAEP